MQAFNIMDHKWQLPSTKGNHHLLSIRTGKITNFTCCYKFTCNTFTLSFFCERICDINIKIICVWLFRARRKVEAGFTITLVPPCGTPPVSSHLTLDFVVPCHLSLPSLQTKDILGQTHAGWRLRISGVTHLCSTVRSQICIMGRLDSKYDPACLRVLAHSSLLLRHTAFKNLF